MFVCSSLRCMLSMCCFHLPVRPTRFGESRKRSVPLRVHSHSKELWFRRPPVARLPTSNPFLTHGTVESPAKLSLQQFHCVLSNGARSPPITSEGFKPTP